MQRKFYVTKKETGITGITCFTGTSLMIKNHSIKRKKFRWSLNEITKVKFAQHNKRASIHFLSFRFIKNYYKCVQTHLLLSNIEEIAMNLKLRKSFH